MKKKRKKRVLRKRAKALLLIIFTLFVMNLHSNAEATAKPKQYEIINYTITRGETLWSIAKKYTPNDKDVRQTIYEIQKENNLDTAFIYAGQEIQIKIEQ